MSKTPNLIWIMISIVLLLAACSEEEKPVPVVEKDSVSEQGQDDRFNINRIARGALFYQEHCAQCHGPEAQGHPDWKHAKGKGYAAAPPLDGNGPAAKRRKAEFVAIIKNGVKYKGKLVMPGWSGRVSDEEIEDVITWFQALWPSDIYARWQQRNGSKLPARARN